MIYTDGKYRTKTHFNKNGSLIVLPALVEKEFGIPTMENVDGDWCGLCLVSVVAYSIGACLQNDYLFFANHITKHIGRLAGKNGYSIDEVIRTFDKPFKAVDGNRNKFKCKLSLNVQRLKNVNQVIDNVFSGQPVIIAIPTETINEIDSELSSNSLNDGCVRNIKIRKLKLDTFHSMLIIGATVENGEKYFILKDTRDSYSYKGYLKVPMKIIQEGFSNLGLFTVEVQGIGRC